MPNPFDQFDAPAANQGGMTLSPLPAKPTDKTSYRTLSPKDAADRGLPPGVYQDSSEGKIDKVADLPKIEADLGQAIKGLGLNELLVNVGRARKQVDSGWATGIPGKIAGLIPGTPRADFLGALEGIKGAAILEKLQALRDQSKTGASGMGSLTEQEGERLANSIASLSPDMSADELTTSLDIMERHAHFLQAIGAGENPDDPAVQKKYKIKPLPGEPEAAAAPTDTPEAPALIPSTDGTRAVIDPNKQALGANIVAMVQKGADRNTVMGLAVGADPTLRDDPRFRAWVDEAVAYHKKNPGRAFPVDPGFYTTQEPLTDAEQNVNEAAQSPIGAGLVAAADTAAGGILPEVVGMIGGDEKRADAEHTMDVMAAANPNANFLGQLSGGTLAALAGELGLAKLGMGPGVGRAAIADTAYGTGLGAGSAEDGHRLEGALYGGAGGLAGSLGGQGVTNFLGKLVKGVTNPAVRGVVDREVPVTIGQAVGGKVKGIEDRLAGLPIVGTAINARRMEGVRAMNSKALNEALKPINGSVGGKLGEEGVADAQDLVGAAFNTALKGKIAAVDHNFVTEAATAKRAIQALPDRVAKEVESGVDEVINNYFDGAGNISGENMQALLQELGQIKRGYAGDPLGHRIGKSVSMVEKSVENLFKRQAPDVMPQYDAAKQAFRRLSIIEDSVLRAKNKGGVFSPSQLGLADRTNAKKFSGTHAAAAGKGEFHDFQRDMQDVLPNEVPDSGTAGRIALAAVPAAIVGSGAGIGYAAGDPQSGAATGLGLAGLLALAYSRHGQRALVGAVTKRGPAARAVGQKIKNVSRLIGHGAATEAALGTAGE